MEEKMFFFFKKKINYVQFVVRLLCISLVIVSQIRFVTIHNQTGPNNWK